MKSMVGKLPSWRRAPILALIAGAVILFWAVVAVFAQWLAPHDVGSMVDGDVFGPMRRALPLGSDMLGRDVLSRIIYGAQLTVGLSLAGTMLAVLTGGGLGMVAATAGGIVDTILSRMLDTVIAVPSLLLGLVVIAALGSSLPILVCTVAVVCAPGAFRIWRSLALNVNAMDYVQVATARGEGAIYIIVREILPNMIRPVLADFGLRFVFVVLLLSSLSFLGLGVQPPLADLGSLVKENMSGLSLGSPAAIIPAVALATLTISVNLFIDSIGGAEGH